MPNLQVRIMAAGKMRNYITYATALLTVSRSLTRNLCTQKVQKH